MTKRNTYIITAIVVAAVVAGVVVYANWDNLRTAIGLGTGQTYDTGWIELRDGTTVTAKHYTVTETPTPASDIPMPAYAPFNGKMSRWDTNQGTWADQTGPVVMQLGSDFPSGTFNVTMKLQYQGSGSEPQAESLKIETFDNPSGTPPAKSTQTIVDDPATGCNLDHTDWVDISTVCSSNPNAAKLTLSFVPNGSIKFTATQGSIAIGGVKIAGVTGGPVVGPNVDIPKTTSTPTIQTTDNMEFDFIVTNTTNAVAHDVILYESISEMASQINMGTSTIGGKSFFSLGQGCSDPTPEGGYCMLNTDNDDYYDTIIAYLPTLDAGAKVPIHMELKPKQAGFTPGAYVNRVGITSKEMNPGNTYPPQTAEQLAAGIATWNWVHKDATVTVTGTGTGLVLAKTVNPDKVQPGQETVFTVSGGNTSSTAQTKVVFWDTWADDPSIPDSNHNFDRQVDGVWIDVVGDTPAYLPLTLPEGQYMDCNGTQALQACYVDVDGDTFGDTILVYTETMPPQSLTKFFDLKFKFKSDAAANTYKNKIGITSCEYNATACADKTYPGNFGVTAWTWASQKEASVTVGTTPPGQPDATLDKSVSPVDGGTSYVPGKEVLYTLTVTNKNSTVLNDVRVIDNYDQSKVTPVAGSGSQAFTDDGDLVTFNLGPVAKVETVTYKATIKPGTGGSTVKNDAYCLAGTSGAALPSCQDDAVFTVGAGPVTPVTGAHAVLSKTVAKPGVTQPGPESTTLTVNPGDKVEYTLTLTNDGDKTLTNMKVTDVFAATYLENVTITQGTSCTSPGLPPEVPGQVCFTVGTMPGTSGSLPIPTVLKYTATVKSGVANGTEVNNNANCQSDEFPKTSPDACHASVMFKVGTGGPSPVGNYELWVTKVVNRATAKRGEKLDYTTTGGNKRPGEASTVWLIDSLLFAQNGEVQLPQLQEAAGKLSSTATIEDAQTVLQQSLGIVSTGSVSQPGTTVQSTRVVQANGDVVYYKNLLGDDATTGLQVTAPIPAGSVLDLDRDGIKDTIIHQKNQTWPGSTSAAQTKYTVNPYTNVRSDLTAGEYRIVNTGVVVKLDTKEVYNARAVTTVNISGPVEAAPAIAVTKTVSDTDETNKTSNTASAGEAMSYTVNYTNNSGAGTAHGAYIEDDYDERYIKITDNGGSTDSGTALLWTLGDVAAGQTVTKTFKVTINSDLAESGATFKNIGTVGAQGQAEKSAEVTTTVPTKTNPSDQPYLVTSKTVVNENGGVIQPGDTLRYTVTIENKGKAAATNASLEDTLPAVLENLKIVTIPTGAKDETTGNKIKITGFTVNAGASVQIVYTANVKAGTANGTKISNGEVVTYGTTGGRSTGTSTGQVGSAFTGPGTGYAEANALEAGAAKAATTGANPLTVALVVTGLAGAAGVTTLILRRRMLVNS